MSNDILTDPSFERSKSMLIQHPAFNDLIRQIEKCQILSTGADEPRCLMIKGEPGVGKTTLARTIAKRFPPQETENGVKIPVFYMVTPSPVTVPAMSQAMLGALGEPAVHQFKNPSAMNARIVELLKSICGVELVILDEFHHLFDSKTNRVLTRVSEWLKTLIKAVNKPFVVIGTDAVEVILDANKQLSRLFVYKELLPFVWDFTQVDESRKFARFIQESETYIGIPLCPDEPREIILTSIYQATEGIVDNIIILFREALYHMNETGQNKLTLDLLAQAYDEGLSGHVRHENPFQLKFRIPGKREFQDPPDSVSQRPAILKPSPPTVSSILSTS